MEKKDTELSAVFNNRISIGTGRQMTLTATDGTSYKSFFTDSLFHSCGYNNPEVIHTINQYIQEHRTSEKAIHPKEFLASLEKDLLPFLPKRLNAICFSSENIYEPVLHMLASKKKRAEFLCLEKPVHFPDTYRSQLFTLKELLGEDENADIHAVRHSVFPAPQTIRIILKKHRTALAGFIINPVIRSDGSFADVSVMEELIQLLLKNHIPIIWDDSDAGFFRTGPAFSFKHYAIQPDVLIVNGRLCHGRMVHLAAMPKKYLKILQTNPLPFSNDSIPGYIMLKAIIRFLKEHPFEKHSTALENRMNGKYRAMMANTQNRFNVSGKGLLYFIRTQSSESAAALTEHLEKNNMLLLQLKEAASTLCFAPPLIVSEEEIDTLLQEIRIYFEKNS